MTKIFKHNFLEVPKLKQQNLESGRVYVGADFAFPSITTVLSKTRDNSFLFEWRKRVGEEKAKQISLSASSRGTKMHTLCEKYLLNEDLGTLVIHEGRNSFSRDKIASRHI